MVQNLFNGLKSVLYFLAQEFELENLFQGYFYFHGRNVDILLLLGWKVFLLDVMSLLQQDIGWMQDDLLVQRVLLELLFGQASFILFELHQLPQRCSEVVLVDF